MKIWTTHSGHKITQLLSGRSNVFLLSNGEKNILIDTSPGNRWRKLDKRLKQLSIDQLDYLILTHTHYDHAGNSAWLRNRYKAQVIVHKSESAYLLSGKNSAVYGTNTFTYFIVKALIKPFTDKVFFKPCQYDILVDTTYDLKSIGFNAYILHTPGHSDGSMSVIVDDEIAIVGDCMFGVFKGSAFPPFALNTGQMIDSWGKLLNTGCSLFLPSHGSADCRELVQRDYDRRKQNT
jgi:hydroxyacylglutathione hydrolase